MESIPLEMEDIYDNEGEGQDFAGVPDLEEDLEPMMREMDTHDDDEAAGDGDGQPITGQFFEQVNHFNSKRFKHLFEISMFKSW